MLIIFEGVFTPLCHNGCVTTVQNAVFARYDKRENYVIMLSPQYKKTRPSRIDLAAFESLVTQTFRKERVTDCQRPVNMLPNQSPPTKQENSISETLLAAQQRLLGRRQSQGLTGEYEFYPLKEGVKASVESAQQELVIRRHSFQSERSVTCEARPPRSRPVPRDFRPKFAESLPRKLQTSPSEIRTIKVNRDIPIAAKKAGEAYLCRLWYLIRTLDDAGSGVVPREAVREAFSNELGIWSWRRLRQMLRDGDGKFWQLGDGGVWYRSASKVAKYLGLPYLTGRAVEVPFDEFVEGVGRYNAAMYAAWHAGRSTNNPISRAKLEELTGACERSQRSYDKQSAMDTRANYTTGPVANPESYQHVAAEHGHGVFMFLDAKGYQGPAGGKYIAHQLPNSYQCSFVSRRSTRQRHINRYLNLRCNGARERDDVDSVFFRNGKQAGRAYDKQGGRFDAYWLSRDSQHTAFWCEIPSQNKGIVC